MFDPPGVVSDERRSDLRDALSDAFDGLDVTLAASEPLPGVPVRPAALVASFSIPEAPLSSLDAFDLLGVPHREDSYTTLIGRAFAHDAGFRSALLRTFGVSAPSAADWRCRLRLGMASGAGKKSVPDVIFFSREARELVIVEAKIHAGEGHRQTTRYGEREARERLRSDLDFDAPEDNQRGFFLTLDGAAPGSSWFAPLTWTAVAKAAESATHPEMVGLLLRELAARVRAHDAWPAPEPRTPVLRYLRRRSGLITEAAVFRRLCDAVPLQHEGFATKLGRTGNRGCGNIPWFQWSKPSWEGESTASSSGISAHFEVLWNTVQNEIALYLHCEPYPYLPKKALQKLHGANALQKHKAAQDKLFTEVERRTKALEAAGWRLRRGYNMLASYRFPRVIRMEDFHAKHCELIRSMSPAVDAWAKQR